MQQSGHSFRAMPGRSGFTLVELLIVCLVISLLMTFLVEASSAAFDASRLADCSSRLRQVGEAFVMYRGECRKFPVAKPPLGFGDRHNWADIWGHIDPFDIVFSPTLDGGVMKGNKTDHPRVPRLLESYAGAVEVLHCTDQGASAWWEDVGPYWYNTTSPFHYSASYPYTAWIPNCDALDDPHREPLAACQSPYMVTNRNASWRHGEKKNRAPGGRNNQLYAGGHVKCLPNPSQWTSQP